jgi:hypothetical protein
MTQNRERGSVTVEVIFAALLTVFAAVLLVQLVMASYIGGVARAAADEGVRAGSRVAAGPTACEERAAQVFASLLPGPLGNDATISCTVTGSDLISAVRVVVDSPTTGMPDFDITASGRAVQEQ